MKFRGTDKVQSNSFQLPSTLVLQQFPSPNAQTPSRISLLLLSIRPTVNQINIYGYKMLQLEIDRRREGGSKLLILS